MVGIVLLNFNTANDVVACIDTIYKYVECDYHIYIVDNASTDSSYTDLKTVYSGDQKVSLMLSEKNNGFSAGNNIGIRKAVEDGMEYICVTNPDILLENDAISNAVNLLNVQKNVGVVCPLINVPNLSIEGQFARKKLTLKNYILDKIHLHNKSDRQIKEGYFGEEFVFTGMASGCFYVARSEFFARGGYLDESVFLFGEEDMMSYKLEKMGYSTCITPACKVFHNHHSSIAKTSPANRVFHLRLSPLVVLRRYAGINKLVLLFLVGINILMWAMKSIRDRDFRAKMSAYVKANLRIFAYKRKEGLKDVY